MSQNDNLHLAQEFLRRMGTGAEPGEIAKLFSENLEWEIVGEPAFCRGSGKSPAGRPLPIS